MELVEPKRTSTVDDDDDEVINEGEEGRIPIIIIRTGGGGNPFPFNPFSGGFPFGAEPALDEEPNEAPGFFDGFPGFPGFPFGGGQPAPFPVGEGEEPASFPPPEELPADAARCGLICQMFRHLQQQLHQVQEEVDEIRRKKQDEENQIDNDDNEDVDDDEGPYHNTTYTEQVRICIFASHKLQK